ncbi:unnamed protein product [Cyprideis torosa]|uniref:Cation/H+ exchanger transmembrane domain-containing protein n=1 Tax=Cyprideis torosa TaxID=163714 RepID=A0A7R8WAK3_9CRUS|nr:unnamed protein product [Cyprideis torosa]CAG0888480.1 unnamed protein product [Cyprideis torosa]
MAAHKTFRIKMKLAKKAKQNRPIPQWVRMRTGNTIRYGLVVGAILRYGSQHRAITHLSVAYQWPPNDTLPPDTLWLNMYENSTTLLEDRNRTYLYQYKGAVRRTTDINEIDMKATFDPEIFFNILLPPIIFNAGFNMKRKYFFRNLGAIMSLAFLGSTIATFVTGSVVYSFVLLVSPFYNIFSFADCLSFGALISATDPVTVLAIFNDLQIVWRKTKKKKKGPKTERSNYASLYHSGGDSAFEFAAFVKSIGSFVSLFTLSFLIGSLMGCLTAILTKFTRLHDYPLLESSLFFLMSYSTFLMAETAELTGIVAVLFCGICQAHYTYNNLSADSQIFELLNFMAENFIFCYIGVSMFTFPLHRWNLGFIIISFLAIAIGRAANIYPLCFLLNCGRKYKIPAKFQHMLFFSVRPREEYLVSLLFPLSCVDQTATCLLEHSTHRECCLHR